MLDYKLLEALAAVVQEGGFEKAARFLNITQSAISQRIKLLEEQTGGILLTRSTPPRATSVGQKMIKHFQQVSRLESDLWSSMFPAGEKGFISAPIGVNADSLATWFLDAIHPFVTKERVVLDLRSDDQDQTHRMLRSGEVLGCVGTESKPIQGCSVFYLGKMDYRMLAAPEFAANWFPHGLTVETVSKAPCLIYNRRDELLHKLLRIVLGREPPSFPAHYFPSTESFSDYISRGYAYGVLPDLQSEEHVEIGKLVVLSPEHSLTVKLYWQCWNIKSRFLENLTEQLVKGAGRLLKR